MGWRALRRSGRVVEARRGGGVGPRRLGPTDGRLASHRLRGRGPLRRLPSGGDLRDQALGVGERLLAPHRRVGQPVRREAQLGQRFLLLHPVLNEAGDLLPASAAGPAALAFAHGGRPGLRGTPRPGSAGAAKTAALPGGSREQPLGPGQDAAEVEVPGLGPFGAGDGPAVADAGALQPQHRQAGGRRHPHVRVVHVPPQGADGAQHGVGVLLGGGHGEPLGESEQKITLLVICTRPGRSQANLVKFFPLFRCAGQVGTCGGPAVGFNWSAGGDAAKRVHREPRRSAQAEFGRRRRVGACADIFQPRRPCRGEDRRASLCSARPTPRRGSRRCRS